jgi:hypothetical protein
MRTSEWILSRALVILLVAVALVSGASAADKVLDGLKPAEPQPTADKLQPGLAVVYVYAILNHIDEFKDYKGGEPGPALSHLGWRMGAGKVLTSKTADGVGATITGLIRFEKPGVYGFDVTSNDGVRVEIGGKLLYEDPFVHADDTSDEIKVKIDAAGWYPIRVFYYEKRNTATLILRWTGGKSGKLEDVPPQAFAHVKQP